MLLSPGAEGRTRTGTRVAPQQILSLPRLPIPPLRRLHASRNMERKTGFEPATPSLGNWTPFCKLLANLAQ